MNNAPTTMEEMVALIKGEREVISKEEMEKERILAGFDLVNDKIDTQKEEVWELWSTRPIKEERDKEECTSFFNDFLKGIGNKGDYADLVEAENQLEELEDKLKEIQASELEEDALNVPGAIWSYRYLLGDISWKINAVEESINWQEGMLRKEELEEENYKIPEETNWERDKKMFQFFQSNFRKWDYKTLCRWNKELSRREDSENNELLFPFAIACKMMTEGRLSLVSQTDRAKNEYKRLCDIYDEYNIGEQIENDNQYKTTALIDIECGSVGPNPMNIEEHCDRVFGFTKPVPESTSDDEGEDWNEFLARCIREGESK